MKETSPYFASSTTRKRQRVRVRKEITPRPIRVSLAFDAVAPLSESWLLSGEISQFSQKTLTERRDLMSKLIWFLERGRASCVDTNTLRAFFAHVTNGHKEPDGRWGNPTRGKRPVKPGTVKTYHKTINAFLNWCIADGSLDENPMAKIPTPVDRPDQVQPFAPDQVKALIAAARRGNNPLRDVALFLIMLDTGMRASEVCSLLVCDVSFPSLLVRVRHGKGNKERSLPISSETKKALYRYLREERGIEEGEEREPLFAADRGGGAGNALTVAGLRFLYLRHGKAAGVQGVRCTSHTMRHTMAIFYLRRDGDVFSLKMLLGHESLTMVNRYVAISQADVRGKHARHSPVGLLFEGKR